MEYPGHNRFEASNEACEVMLAQSVPDTAVVFVHGWAGDPDATWASFHTLIDTITEQHSPWSRADVFFYRYDSVRVGVRPNALDFGEFLLQIFPQPAPWVLTEPLNPISAKAGIDGDVLWRENFQGYSHLYVVAHSAGATVVRHWFLELANEVKRALDAQFAIASGAPDLEQLNNPLEAAESAPKSQGTIRRYSQEIQSAAEELIKPNRYACLKAHLRLFAPAHCGASISGKYGALLEIAGSLGKGVLQHSTMAVDLAPVSPLISNLRPKTEGMARELPNLRALAAQILWGKEDKIVYMDKFDCDTDTFVSEQDHISVCKPSREYLFPLKFVFHGSKTTTATV